MLLQKCQSHFDFVSHKTMKAQLEVVFEAEIALIFEQSYIIGQWLWLNGRAVTSDTRGPWFESSCWSNFVCTFFQLY